MPILSSAKKALRVSKRKAIHNKAVKSRVKTAVDSVKKTPTMELLSEAYSAIDRAVKNNIFKANRAARIKAQLAKLVKPTKLEKKPVAKVKKASKPVAKTTKVTAKAKSATKAKSASAKKASSKAAPKSAKK